MSIKSMRKERSIRRMDSSLTGFAVFLCLIFNIVLPVSQNGLRAIILFVCFAIGVIITSSVGSRFKLNRGYSVALISSMCIGALGLLMGLINDNPGIFYVAPLYIVWPLVYSTIFANLDLRIHRKLVENTLIVGLAAVSLLMIWYVLYYYRIIPFYLPIDFGQAFNPAIPEMRFYGISSLIFLIPFAAVYFMIDALNGRVRISLLLVLALGFIAAYFSGRRALIIVSLLVPVVFMLYYASQNKRRLFNAGKSILLVSVAIYIITSINPAIREKISPLLNKMVSYIAEEYSPKTVGQQESVRSVQTRYLLESWRESPLIGHGLGQSLAYTRNDDRTWEYESQYPMMLSNLGILGGLVLSLSACWIIYSLFRLSRLQPEKASFFLGINAGLLSFIVSNNSNPYFQAFGHLWVIFLPAAIVVAGNREIQRQKGLVNSLPFDP